MLNLQRVWEVRLNCSRAPISTHNFELLNFSRWSMDIDLYGWWRPEEIKLCHSKELTWNYVIVFDRSELSCCSSKLFHLCEQQNKMRILRWNSQIWKRTLKFCESKFQWPIHRNQSNKIDKIWFFLPKIKVEPSGINFSFHWKKLVYPAENSWQKDRLSKNELSWNTSPKLKTLTNWCGNQNLKTFGKVLNFYEHALHCNFWFETSLG